MRTNRYLTSALSLLLATVLLLVASQTIAGEVYKELPPDIDPNGKYLFFLHGKIVEEKGAAAAESKKLGFYEYKKILKALAERGYSVISEARPHTDSEEYSQKLAAQIETLISKGTQPQAISVAGYEKGGEITLLTAARVGREQVNYVVLSGCKGQNFLDRHQLQLQGRILSIRLDKDKSCRDLFAGSTGALEHNEITLQSNSGQALFYEPKEVWIAPLLEWIK